MIRPHSPAGLVRGGLALRSWGLGPAGGFTAAARLDPHRTAVIDDLGSLTYDQLHRRSNALARAFADHGVGSGDGVAIMCRNHRGFIDASIATAKLGADSLYLNTAFARPQLLEVVERERPKLIVLDQEFADLLEGAEVDVRVLAWTDGPTEGPTIESLIASRSDADLAPASRHGSIESAKWAKPQVWKSGAAMWVRQP